MKNKLLLFSIVLFNIFALNSCMITPKYHITDSYKVQENENDGIRIKCTYLNREDIIKRHGTKHNPFLAPYRVMTPQPVIIFELEITNLEEGVIKLDQRKIDFFYNDKNYTPMSRLKMRMKIEDEVTKGSERLRQERIVKQYMFNDIEKIKGNQTVTKYIIYMRNLKDRGESELVIPIYTIDGLEAADFSFFYNFTTKNR